MSGQTVVLVRHAQASFGSDDYDRLSPTGQTQACRLGEWMAESGIAPTTVVIGPRRRHRDTAERCLATTGIDLPLQVMPELDEVDHVELLKRLRPDLRDGDALRAELRTHDDPQRAFQRIFEQAIARWMSGTYDDEYAVSWPGFRNHVQAALAQLADMKGPVWAFTSGGPIGVLAGSAVGLPIEQGFRMSWPLLNTSLNRLRIGKRGATLVGYNAWPHLERHDLQSLLTMR